MLSINAKTSKHMCKQVDLQMLCQFTKPPCLCIPVISWLQTSNHIKLGEYVFLTVHDEPAFPSLQQSFTEWDSRLD
jgi:hypothetical protein